MKKPSQHLILALFFSLLNFLTYLVDTVRSHEDPGESIKRQTYAARLTNFRSTYRQAYIFDQPRPIRRPSKLKGYPKSIVDIVEKLDLYGFAQRSQDDNLAGMLSNLDKAFTALLHTYFHPDSIERQPQSVLRQHFFVTKKMVSWTYEHMHNLIQHSSVDQAGDRLRRYKQLRNLAAAAIMIPRP